LFASTKLAGSCAWRSIAMAQSVLSISSGLVIGVGRLVGMRGASMVDRGVLDVAGKGMGKTLNIGVVDRGLLSRVV